MTDPDDFRRWLEERNPHQPEFTQAVGEVADDVVPYVNEHEAYSNAAVLERLCEPDRIISFRVTWLDDDGAVQINRGWRVQHSNAIGPYKGGLRFHPGVSESVLKFLGFEQTFKNALTGLPMGGAKGGSDFNPKGRSEGEIMRFCQAFMTELYRHIGPETDVPAGDINVGEREIGYLFGRYKKITNRFQGVLTGKGIEYGGAPMRPEATGYGVVYFSCRMLEEHDEQMEGKRIAISGAGNVAVHAAQKAIELGAVVVSLSNSDGVLFCKDGFSKDAIATVRDSDERLGGLAKTLGAEWKDDAKPWMLDCDVALPCATQNELDEDDAQALVSNGVLAVAEGANMPCTAEARAYLRDNGVIFGPAKATNAGGVALSGLEMSQNAAFEASEREHLGERLRQIMCSIHDRCLDAAGDRDGSKRVNYSRGANIAGFRKVADAMLAFGVA